MIHRQLPTCRPQIARYLFSGVLWRHTICNSMRPSACHTIRIRVWCATAAAFPIFVLARSTVHFPETRPAEVVVPDLTTTKLAVTTGISALQPLRPHAFDLWDVFICRPSTLQITWGPCRGTPLDANLNQHYRIDHDQFIQSLAVLSWPCTNSWTSLGNLAL